MHVHTYVPSRSSVVRVTTGKRQQTYVATCYRTHMVRCFGSLNPAVSRRELILLYHRCLRQVGNLLIGINSIITAPHRITQPQYITVTKLATATSTTTHATTLTAPRWLWVPNNHPRFFAIAFILFFPVFPLVASAQCTRHEFLPKGPRWPRIAPR